MQRQLRMKIWSERFQPSILGGLVLVVLVGGLSGFNPLLGLISAMVLLLFITVFPRPILIVYALAFLQPLLGGFARGVGVPFLRLGQALLVFAAVLFVLAIPSRQGKWRLTPLDVAFLLYFIAGSVLPVLALLYRGEHVNLSDAGYYNAETPLQTLLGPLQYYVLYRIVVATVVTERQIVTLLKLSFCASILVSMIGILQKLGVGPVTSFLNTYYPQAAIYTNLHATLTDLRITSTLSSFSGLAAYLCFMLILVLACHVYQERLHISPLLLLTTLAFDGIALLLTGTFSAIIGLAIGAFVVFRLARRIPRLVIAIIAAMGLAALLFSSFIVGRFLEWLGTGSGSFLPTYAERIRLWREIFLPAIGQHLIFGSGPAPAVSNLWLSEESQYFALLLHGGLFYFFTYMILIGLALACCWRVYKGHRDGRQVVAIALFAILITMSFMNVSAVYFTYVGGTQVLWTLLAILVATDQFKPPAIHQAVPVANVSVPALPGGSTSVDSAAAEPQQRRSWLKRRPDWHFVKDSFVVGIGSMVSRILGLLFSTLLAHFLSSDAFGFFRYSITLAGIVTIATNASPAIFARFLAAKAGNREEQDRYFSNGLLGLLVLLFVSLVLSLPVLWLLGVMNFAIISCIVSLAAFYGYLAIARGMNSAWKIGLSYALSNVALIIALLVICGLFKARTAAVAVSIYGLTNLVPIVLLELCKPMHLRFRVRYLSKKVQLELLRFAAPLILSTAAYTIWSGLDMLIVQNVVPHAAGGYAAVKTLSGAFLFVPAAITMLLLPRAAAQDLAKSKRYCLGAAWISLLVSLLGVGLVWIAGHQLLSLAFGRSYGDAYMPLLITSIGMSIYSVYVVLEGFVIGRGRPDLPVVAMLVALLATAATCFWFTRQWGAIGASLSFSLGAVLCTAIMSFGTWRLLVQGSRSTTPTQSLQEMAIK